MSQKLQYSLFKRLFSFAKPYKKYLVVAVSATILLAALSPSRPFVIGQIIDPASPTDPLYAAEICDRQCVERRAISSDHGAEPRGGGLP